jgi:hypothetical protein
MKEAELEKYFNWCVQSIGGKTYKFKSMTMRGVADRVVCLPDGQTWFVELKRPEGRLSALQEIFAEDMHALNQRYACLWSKEQINEWTVQVSYGYAI